MRDNSVEFRDYAMRYRAGLPLVLEGVSCVLRRHNERVHIVGRTGSGKSSLAAALLRLVPPAASGILIGGVDAERIPLRELRAMAAVWCRRSLSCSPRRAAQSIRLAGRGRSRMIDHHGVV